MAKKKPRSDYEVYLQGHCHYIGDGWRGVQVIEIGRKWVRFRATGRCRTCKVLKTVWEKLVANAYRRAV